MASWEQYLKKIYYDSSNPASFAGPDELCRFVRKDEKLVLNKYKINKLLRRQELYSLQRAIKRHVNRNRVVVFVIYDQWDVDLMDMTKYSKYNCWYNFILVAIDIISKYVWLWPLKTKRGEYVMKALNNVFAEGRPSNRIRIDKGQ